MEGLGTHLLLELRDCDPAQLDNLPFIRSTMLKAARDLGVTVLSHHFHKFSPQGVTGIISIAESHFSIHTWPEHGYAAVDIFTCGTSWPPAQAARMIIDGLRSRDPEIREIKRGLLPVYSR
ncbi:MAG: adenosylmethionine decarboxylase [Chloroflexi bacterium]|nr:adenosylmethionine decarboxylase [Chloroflexota bacterium]